MTIEELEEITRELTLLLSEIDQRLAEMTADMEATCATGGLSSAS